MKTSVYAFIIAALLFTNASHAQYCTLPGRIPYSTDQPGITNFKLGTINRTSLGVESMSAVLVVTTDSTVLLRGHTYTVTITHNKDIVNFPTSRNNIRVWIDYNNNFSFDDAGETVITSDLQTPGVFTANFTVPATATLGTVRLRATAKMSADAGHSIPTTCDMPADPIGYHGEMEDYKVKIVPTTGINEITGASLQPVVYPNPTSGNVTIAFDAIGNEPISVEMMDVTGKRVATLLSNQPQSSLSYSFDLNNYTQATGVYFVRVSSARGASYYKVVKVD